MRTFPTIQGRNLEGRDMLLPDELIGTLRCVVVAFQRQHQQLVDTWLPRLAELADAHPGFAWYEMPTISRRWSIARSFIDGGMAQAIADQGARERTITVYGSVSPIITALGLESAETIATVLVDAAGDIVWQATGPCTPQLAGALEVAVAEHLMSAD